MTTSSPFYGNWTPVIQSVVKGKTSATYNIGQNNSDQDPAVGCLKDFTSTYQCGNIDETKTINIPGEARGKPAIFDCSKACKGFRLTLGDNGNLTLTDIENKQLWTSNTSKIGLVLERFNAKNGKYGRNYLLSGETLNLGEFIGSPSGNCYLIMEKTPEGNSLQLNYSVLNCTDNQFGNDEMTNGLFSLAKSAYNELIGTTNKVKPEMNKLDKTMDKLMKEENTINTSHTRDSVNDYMGVRNAKPIITKQIQQLEAMGEDSGLYLTRYKYRRILWLVLAILVVLGGIKLARNS